jgi:hypothetical protein
MESLPSELISFIQQLRPLFRAEVFNSFCYLMMGLLVGDAKQGTVRSSAFAPAGFWPQRLSDLSGFPGPADRACAIASLSRLPKPLFWIADSTHTEKPYGKRIASVGLSHRTQRVAGRAKHLVGQCYVFAASLYQHAINDWRSVSRTSSLRRNRGAEEWLSKAWTFWTW